MKTSKLCLSLIAITFVVASTFAEGRGGMGGVGMGGGQSVGSMHRGIQVDQTRNQTRDASQSTIKEQDLIQTQEQYKAQSQDHERIQSQE